VAQRCQVSCPGFIRLGSNTIANISAFAFCLPGVPDGVGFAFAGLLYLSHCARLAQSSPDKVFEIISNMI
jgi:hypothetical protein